MTSGALLGMAAAATPAAAHVTATTGLTVVTPPPSVGSNFILNQSLPNQLIFDEQQGVVLGAALATDLGGTIAAGTKVDSHFFAVNGSNDTTVDTSATFSGLVLGVIYWSGSPNYAASDFLGAPGTAYGESCGNCGFESGPDSVSFLSHTVNFHTNYSTPGDFARVITASASGAPEPTAWTLMLGGFGAAGALLRRARAQRAIT